MNKKIFLTSVIAMGFVAPAMAEPSNTDTFPQDGLMQEDYTYTNAATSTNMAGVYEGTVDAVAQYENILYTIAAGQYLPAGGESVINCDQSGYFCPGLQSQVQYDAQNAQGLTSCSTVGDGSYTSSDGTGSTADSCYRQCSGNVTIEHATAVTGFDYYGAGVDTCEPTACENGWHVESGSGVPNLTQIIDVTTDYSDTTYGDDFVYINNNGDAYKTLYDTEKVNNVSSYGISNRNDFAIFMGDKGVFRGQGRCSTIAGSNGSYTNGEWDGNGDWSNTSTRDNLTDEAGEGMYCWCKYDTYTQVGGQTFSLSVPWVFSTACTDGGAGECESDCARYCGIDFLVRNDFRAKLFSLIPSGSATCEANTITINWTGTSETEINANDAGTATYGSDIRTPRSATPVPGKTFTGWRFSAPQQASVQEP